MATAYKDDNDVSTLIASSNIDGKTPVRVLADPNTGRLLVDLGSGTVGLQSETPTGTVNGSNTAFTTSNTPKFVIADGNIYVAGFGFSYAGGIITMDIAPIRWIRDLY